MKKLLDKFWLGFRASYLLVCLAIFLIAPTVKVSAQGSPLTQCDIQSLIGQHPYYDNCGQTIAQSCLDTALGSIGGGAGTTSTNNEQNQQIIWDFLRSHGLSPIQAAAIMGNIESETAGTFDPSIVQGGGHSDSPVPGAGYGLAQWTTDSRQQGLINLANSAGVSPSNLGIQLQYLWNELSSNNFVNLSEFEATTDLQTATFMILEHYEAPKDIEGNKPVRLSYAQGLLLKFGSSAVDASGPLIAGCLGQTSSTIGGQTSIPPGTPAGSSLTPCDPRTKDAGIYTGYQNGNPVQIRLCSLPNLSCSNEECNNGFGISGADGHALVNSTVSKQYYDLVQAARQAGVTLYATSTFRTMAHQQAICAQNSGCSSGDYTYVAKPGTSNHQMGLAIDFGSSPGVALTTTDPGYTWLKNNASRFGIYNYPAEAWHWSPTGS